MKPFYALSYCVEEAFVELWRNRLVNLVSIATIAVSLFILGVFTSISGNLRTLVAGWSSRVQLTVYLSETTSENGLKEIEAILKSTADVESFDYFSKTDAADRFRSYFPDLANLTDLLDSNPLPASFEVQIAPEARTPDNVRSLAARIQQLADVDEVDYDLLWIERLSALIRLVQILGWSIGSALVLASVFTIYNVIKLTVYARHEEIGIMRLVGATHAYIRGPFIVEGMFHGGLGGLLALGLLFAAHEFLVRQAISSFHLVSAGENWFRFLSPTASLTLILGGMMVGFVGSAISVRKFLSGAV